MRKELEKYVENGVFDQHKEQMSREFKETEGSISSVRDDIKNLEKLIGQIDEKATKASK